eukprot:280624_1
MGTVCLPGTNSDQPQTETEREGLKSAKTKKAPSPRVLIIQNDVLCPPCSAIASLIEHEIPYQVIYGFHEFAFRNIEPIMYEAIIVLGGRAGAYESDKFKWLENEMKFIKTALKNKIPILGICLGCQLLAKCAGGEVFPGDKGVEIGYQDWIFDEEENKNDDMNKLDPFLHALQYKDMDKYVILFHGDTFSVPVKCTLNDENIQILAKTEKYLTLYKIGEYSYGFQGHPELNHDLVSIWCKSWSEAFLNKSEIDIEEVTKYSEKNKELIDISSKILFDIWIDVALLRVTPELTKSDTNLFDEYAEKRWGKKDTDNKGYHISYTGLPKQ